MNHYRELIRKINAGEPLTRVEKITFTKLGMDKLNIYADACDEISGAFRTRHDRTVKIKEIAEKLGISTSTLIRNTKPQLAKPLLVKELREGYADTIARRIDILKGALEIIASDETANDAALRAGCSYRTIYRRANELLEPLCMNIRSVRQMRSDVRRGLANDIEQTHMPALVKEHKERLAKAQEEYEIRTRKAA